MVLKSLSPYIKGKVMNKKFKIFAVFKWRDFTFVNIEKIPFSKKMRHY